ncbi:MAG: hypothetical protein MUQ10_02510 [Anaerolineae bacterium]|nr:hypothetical protein [Anaerolineae bacterium]
MHERWLFVERSLVQQNSFVVGDASNSCTSSEVAARHGAFARAMRRNSSVRLRQSPVQMRQLYRHQLASRLATAGGAFVKYLEMTRVGARTHTVWVVTPGAGWHWFLPTVT